MLLAAFLPAAAPVPVAQRPAGTIRLAPDTDAAWVPFDLTPGNQIRFRAMVDGRPAVAILDTGVSYSLASVRFAATARGPVRRAGTARAVGGIVRVGWRPTRTVAFGGLTRRGGGLAVAALPAIATGTNEPADLLVGGDLLAAAALDIDYPARRFRLLPSGRLPFAGAAAPLSVSPGRRVYRSALVIDGRRVAPVLVDTGDGAAITLGAAAWRAVRDGGAVAATTAIAYGLAGPSVTDLAILPALRLGALSARDVEVRAEPPGGFSEAVGMAGRVGSGFLGRYRVLLDPGAGRMVLLPGPDAGRPPARSTSGLLLGVAGDRLRVLHVMRGGPAEAAGWKAGDTICAVDGRAVGPDPAADADAGWPAGEPGRVVALTGCGPDASTRRLTLRRFY